MSSYVSFFIFNDTATTEIYTLSLHDALPISVVAVSFAVVVCVSETTGGGGRPLWGIPAERIVVARHGPGQGLPALQRTRAEHFLYVGDTEPRKDLGTLL